ncbi:hypothetical protein [Streptomyces fuscigenes]|uniref:hypothetical protein n=1 Tax=Streptomyces fuscigenes TaxID=1528880 RepID=UPI001F169538|nr:hypothetical protein [Streptomyces fuscigenes]MCF3964043.1 hypothetical protein [Streptomyces fuscigenes]
MTRTSGGRARRRRLRFDGWIAGTGTASGTRAVLGHWPLSPFGAFSDVMVEDQDGHRTLLAPTRQTADFVAATYSFDTVRVVPVQVVTEGRLWEVAAGPLEWRFAVGPRGPLGLALRAVPGAVARRPAWGALTDRPASALLDGVRTRGSAGGDRREWYGARDLRPLAAVSASWEGADLGAMAPIAPPVRFGFGSVPRTPSLVRVTSTVEVADTIGESGPLGGGHPAEP